MPKMQWIIGSKLISYLSFQSQGKSCSSCYFFWHTNLAFVVTIALSHVTGSVRRAAQDNSLIGHHDVFLLLLHNNVFLKGKISGTEITGVTLLWFYQQQIYKKFRLFSLKQINPRVRCSLEQQHINRIDTHTTVKYGRVLNLSLADFSEGAWYFSHGYLLILILTVLIT